MRIGRPGNIRPLAAALLVWLGIWSIPATAHERNAEPLALVEREGDSWTIEYNLPQAAAAWAFPSSNILHRERQSWRVGAWQIETPGVELVRLQNYDVLRAQEGTVPQKLRIKFAPETRSLRADYEPALQFSDGNLALFNRHFLVTPIDLETGQLANSDHQSATVRFIDRGRTIWHVGRRFTSINISGGRRYVLFGDREPFESDNLSLLLDNAMPPSFHASIRDFTPQLMDYYSAQLGPRRNQRKPAVWASWSKSSEREYSFNGSVLPGQIILSMIGHESDENISELKPIFQQFIAHEAAHFWLGESVRDSAQPDRWILEGGATVAAVYALEQFTPEYDANSEKLKLAADCARDAAAGAMTTTQQRQNFDIFYSCGAVFHLVAEKLALQRNSDWFAFTQSWMSPQGKMRSTISTEEWLAAIRDIGADQAVVAAMQSIHSSADNEKRAAAVRRLSAYLDLSPVGGRSAMPESGAR